MFARMLALEFDYLHLKARSAVSLDRMDRTDVLILDLDSASAPPADQYRTMIGFSRRPALSAEDARCCSMILRRPFRMSLLRQEVLAQTGVTVHAAEGDPFEVTMSGERTVRLDHEKNQLICDRQAVALTPHEMRIVECLLNNRSRAVSRKELASLIGQSDGNKTDVYICYLRRKTDGLPNGRLIRTVRGKGYQIP